MIFNPFIQNVRVAERLKAPDFKAEDNILKWLSFKQAGIATFCKSHSLFSKPEDKSSFAVKESGDVGSNPTPVKSFCLTSFFKNLS